MGMQLLFLLPMMILVVATTNARSVVDVAIFVLFLLFRHPRRRRRPSFPRRLLLQLLLLLLRVLVVMVEHQSLSPFSDCSSVVVEVVCAVPQLMIFMICKVVDVGVVLRISCSSFGLLQSDSNIFRLSISVFFME